VVQMSNPWIHCPTAGYVLPKSAPLYRTQMLPTLLRSKRTPWQTIDMQLIEFWERFAPTESVAPANSERAGHVLGAWQFPIITDLNQNADQRASTLALPQHPTMSLVKEKGERETVPCPQ
jgi:hypothetical protein